MALITFFATYKGFISEHKKGLLLVLFTAIFIAYLAFGGFCFLALEGSQEKVLQEKILDIKSKIIQKHPGVPDEALKEFLSELSSIGIRGVVASNATQRWTFGNAVFFAATLLTTVGYGHLWPMTPVGKVACMAYIAVGIPMSLCLMAAYVHRLMMLSEIYLSALFRSLQDALKPVPIRLLHITSILALILICWFFVPALLFTYMEVTWSFLDALYFCFISLTTVGLGDLVPGIEIQHSYVDLYRLGAALYLITGVTVMMFMMSLTIDYLHNYNTYYHETLPFEMPAENISFSSANIGNYGSMLVNSTKIIEENKLISSYKEPYQN